MNKDSFCLKEYSYCFVATFLLIFPTVFFAQKQVESERIGLVKRYLQSVGDFGYAGQVLIAEKDQIQVHQPYGLANREQVLTTTPETVFGLASASKAFTAIAILLLEKEGKLGVKDSLGQFFTSCPRDKAGINIHQLLTHSSGIGGGDLVPDYAKVSKADLLKKIFATPLRAKPGQKWMYSNAGYNLLAAIIEQKSGLDYAAYLHKAIFKPFKLQHTYAASEIPSPKVPLAIAYQGALSNASPSALEFNVRTWGGGSVCSTAGDLFLLKKALFNPSLFDEILRQKMFNKHQAINKDGYSYYGYGCLVYKSPRDQEEVIDIIGNTERGFNCTLRIWPENDEVFISISNARHVGGSPNREFLDAHLRNLWVEPKHFAMPPPVQVKDPKILSKYTGKYTFQNSVIELRLQGHNLIAEATGKEAIALLYPSSGKVLEHWESMEKAIANFMRSYAEESTDGFKQIMSNGQLQGFVEERNALLQEMGPFKGFQIKGIFPDFDPGFVKCPLVLEFEKGTSEMFTLWNLQNPSQPMIDFSAPGEKSSVAKILANLTPNTFSSYNFLKDEEDLTLNFEEQNNNGIVLSDEQGTCKFIKVS